MKYLLPFLLLSGFARSGELVKFPAADGLPVTAEISKIADPEAPFLILCHQAGWSRGEYSETANWFNELGFHTLALDQRSGGEVNGVLNQTAKLAKERGLSTDYLDAKQDIEAALDYVRKTYAPQKIVLLGSSYSASLVLRITGENKYPVDAVLAFSPGEYFQDQSDYVASKGGKIQAQVFITSAANERHQWTDIAKAIPKNLVNAFIPNEKGEHGSRALWQGKSGWPLYRRAVQAFLARIHE